MSDNIRETVPKVLKTLWDLEKDLRGAAQNGVVLRRDEAKRHLSDARRHLDALLGLAQNTHPQSPAIDPSRADIEDEVPTPSSLKN